MPRRVAVVTTWFPSAERPTEAPFNLDHTRAIARSSDVAVFHLRLGGSGAIRTEDYAGFRVTRIPLSPRHPLRALRGLRILLLRTRTADIVQTMAFSSVLAVALIRPWLRRPWAHIEHWNGVSAPESVGRLWYAFRWLRRLLGLTDFVGGVTGELTRCLEHFAKGKPSAVVPCVVENPEPIPDARPEGLHLVALGGLIPRKNPLLAVDVVAALRERHPEVTMRWVGDGPQRAAVAARIAELGLGDVVTLVGNVPPERRFREFAPASLYFLPTTQENFFTSAAEALSAGLPVVAARVGGFTDFADDSNSVLIGRDEMRVQPFVAAIEEAASRFADVGPAAIAEPIRARFGLDTLAEQFDRIHSALLA